MTLPLMESQWPRVIMGSTVFAVMLVLLCFKHFYTTLSRQLIALYFLVLTGYMSNLTVVLANGFHMPVLVPRGFSMEGYLSSHSIWAYAQNNGHFLWLADRFQVGNSVGSIGDAAIYIGGLGFILCFIYHLIDSI